MTRAFAYLYLTSVRNALLQRLRRLRQPKYLAGAVVGAAYFWFFLFRNTYRSGGGPLNPSAAGFAPWIEPVGSAILLVVAVAAWLVGNRRAALHFSEAEVAFLFPAPVTRRTLIHYKLLHSQLGILLSAVFVTLVFRRGSAAGGTLLIHGAGWWLILSTLSLHLLGASFVRERLLTLGVNPLRRRVLVGALLLGLVAACWLGLRAAVHAPTEADLSSTAALQSYVLGVLDRAPLSWVLLPFRLVVRPYAAATAQAFLAAFGPGLLMLGAHYVWVMRSDVAFEEASLELAAKRAARIAAVREGRWRTRELPTKPKPEPFRLAPTGWAPLAYLWKNLISLGPFYRFRTWAIASGATAALFLWLGHNPDYEPFLKAGGAGALAIMFWLLVGGPMFMHREIQQTLTQLDITKAYPAPGWQVVLGNLLTPITLLTFAQWYLLLVAVLTLGRASHDLTLALLFGAGGGLGIFLLTPALSGLMLCIPYAGVLFFPAWARPAGSAGTGGIELMGQRLIFLAGYLIVLVVSLVPVALAGAAVYVLATWLLGQAAAVACTGIVAAALLTAELAAAVWWLGDKLDRFDLSTELPRG